MPVAEFPPREHFRPEMVKCHGERVEWDGLKASEGVDLTGKTMVVTGANSGIGTETVRTLVKRGCKVLATARSKDKLDALVKELGADKVEAVELELNSLKSVDAFVAALQAKGVKLDAFINNAGTMANPFTKTEDGFEMQVQVNHLAVAVLVSGLLHHKLLADTGRIVVVATSGHRNGGVPLSAVNWDSEEGYNKWLQYGVSKGLVITFCNYVAARLAEAGSKITINSLHPGAIPTNLVRDLSEAEMAAFGDLFDEKGTVHPVFKTVPEGCATSVWAAVSPELEGKSGNYLENCQITPKDKDFPTEGAAPQWLDSGVKPYVFDTERQAEVFAKTEEQLKRKLPLA